MISKTRGSGAREKRIISVKAELILAGNNKNRRKPGIWAGCDCNKGTQAFMVEDVVTGSRLARATRRHSCTRKNRPPPQKPA